MDVLKKRLKVSINTRLVNKDELKDRLAHRDGWENRELTPSELAQSIHKGYAYSVQVADGIRRTEKFLASDVASVDIDWGRTIVDALSDPFCWKYLTIFFLTKSSTKGAPRFRLVFALPRTITDPLEQRALNRALALRLAGDPSATDAVRISYGSDLQKPKVFNRGITIKVLDELIAQGISIPRPDTATSPGRSASMRARQKLDRDTVVRTAKGASVQLKDIVEKTPIHCPFHHDKSSSAFVNLNARKSQYMHCQVCQTTWWTNDGASLGYDFDSFEKAIDSFKGDEEASTALSLLLSDEEVLPPRKLGKFKSAKPNLSVHKSANTHFELPVLSPGITFIRSPKGSGKTTSLPAILHPLAKRNMTLEVFEEDYDERNAPRSIDSSFSILLIGHRRALIRDLCARLNLNCYLDDKDSDYQETELRKKHYGVCVDSLWKVRKRTYNLIVIDESEQVLSHFLAETLKNREALFSEFHALLSTAGHVIALDADLSWISYGTLCKLGHALSVDTREKRRAKPVTIYSNKPKLQSKEILLFRSKDHLLADFEAQVKAGSRIFLTSNSKAKIDAISEILRDRHKGVKHLAITSENSNTEDIQDFIINIKKRIADYQVILTSPSLGTGVDITLVDDAAKIDIVYGFFENLINTHFDIDQQIRRVRAPKEVRVWVSARKFNFETDTATVRSDLENGDNGLLTFTWGPTLLDLAAGVVAMQRASKNRLKDNFIAYKAAQGWKAKIVDSDKEMAKAGKESFNFGRNLLVAHRAERLLSAEPIVQGDYLHIEECLEDDDEISEAQMLSFLRAKIELFYRQAITSDLIGVDDQSRFRSCVIAYEGLMGRKTEDPWEQVSDEGKEDARRKLRLLPNRPAIPWLLNKLLSETPIYKDHRFDTEVIYTGDDLSGFIKVVQHHRKEIENLLGRPIPKDLAKKPMSYLGNILAVAGVKHLKVDKKRNDGETTYFYQLDAGSLRSLESIAKLREEHPHRWKFLHELHGLDGALYERNFHPTSDDQTKGVWYLVPVTEGKAVKLKRTDRLAKKLGFDPYLEEDMKKMNKQMKERFAALKKLKS